MSTTIGRQEIRLEMILEISLGSAAGMLRAFPVDLSADGHGILAIYGADFDVDPYNEMFFLPSDTLKFVLFNEKGEIMWRRDLGRGIIPGIWFCPVFPFDLDGDGVDEIWFVNNLNSQHPLSTQNSCLERLDARSGQTIGQFPWVYSDEAQPLSLTFRNFIAGGYVHGEPVIITAQGTYEHMYLQGWNKDMTPRWQIEISKDDPGARGSHMCPVLDLNGDGIDELLWGERCFELDKGTELFCADRDAYNGHSDVIQPILDEDTGHICLYTIRESDPNASPRVVLFTDKGERVWGQVEQGHMDMGWVARIAENRKHVVMAIRIGEKTCGPEGRFHQDMDEFMFDALSGEPIKLPFSVYRTLPVDINGDGYHELVRGMPGGDGEVLDRFGNSIATVGGTVVMASKFLNRPGEQILCYYPDGTLRIWADVNAVDNEQALVRYRHPFYKASQRLTGVGYNLVLMAGI